MTYTLAPLYITTLSFDKGEDPSEEDQYLEQDLD
jgi:hypothetical protein